MPIRMLKVGVVGATGLVGQEFIKIFEQRKFPIEELRPFASLNSQGQRVRFRKQDVPVRTLEDGCFKGLDVVFFSSGEQLSLEWAPRAVTEGCIVIDNSSAYRMNPEVHLVVPEVNGSVLKNDTPKPQIIANPNCSTVQLVVALEPLKKTFGIDRVHVASYQSVSGAGRDAIEELKSQCLAILNNNSVTPSIFPHQIAFNNIPQIGSFDETGFCTEETKIMSETRKIMNLPDLKISAFTVRVPSLNSHSEAVWVTLKQKTHREQIISLLNKSPGIQVIDSLAENKYPTAYQANGTDPVYVGRIHRDLNDPNTWLMWVVSDNLRKGAALNAIQIAEYIYKIEQ